MDESARGDTGPDADPVRALVMGMLDRIEHFAATVISDRESGADRVSPAGLDLDGMGRRVADLGPTVRAAIESVITESAEMVNRLIAAVIAVLEAISVALEDAVGERDRLRHNASARTGRSTSFQPIVVEVETGEPPR